VPTEGLLTEVLITERGSNAAAVATVGATELLVADITDFTDYTSQDTTDPDTSTITGIGVIVDILGERYTVDTVTPGIPEDQVTEGAGGTYDETAELTPGTLTLTEPLAIQVDEDDPVWLVVGTEVATDAYALVSFPQTAEVTGEADEAGDVAQVPIPYGMRASFPEGLYDPPAPIVVADDLSQVLDVPGVQPKIDGSSIVNPPPPAEPTEPPASSPAVEVHGTIDSLVVEVIEDYAGTTTLDFHISTEPDFAPSAATLSGSSRSAVFVIVSAPVTDEEGNVTSQPLALDTIYYVRTVARNVVGAAEPGPITPGVLDPSKVSEIVTARLVAGFILTGSIQVGNITINPETGITIPQSNGGTITFPADGSAATVDAHINARSLNVEQDWSINGYGELGGDLVMRAGIPNPAVAPVVTQGWPTIEVPDYSWSILYLEEGGNPWLPGGSSLIDWQEFDVATQQFVGAERRLNGVPRTIGDPNRVSVEQVWRDDTTGGVWVFGYRINHSPQDYVFLLLDPTWETVVETYVIGTMADLSYVGVGVNPDRTNNVVLVFTSDTGVRTRTYTLDGTVTPGAASALLPGAPTGGYASDAVGFMFGTGSAKQYLYLNPVGAPTKLWAFEADPGSSTWVRRTTADMTRAGSDSVGPKQLLAVNPLGDNHDQELLEVDHNGGDTRVYRHARPNLAGDVLKAAYTWADRNATNGTHETAASPTTTVTLGQGMFPVIVGGAAPEAEITDPTRVDLADRIGIYAAFGAAALTRFDYLAKGIRGTNLGDVTPITPPTAGNPPPASNGFAALNADPASIKSQATDSNGPLIDLSGDGVWRLGGLSGSAAGVVSGQGRVQAGVSTYRATANSGAPGTRLGTEATPTIWSNSILRGFTYDSSTGTWTCQAGAAGAYLVFAKASWAADTVNDWGCGVQVWKNDAQMGGINDIALHSKALGNSTGPTLVAPIEIAVGDRMQVSIWQNSGTARTPNGMQFYLLPLLG